MNSDIREYLVTLGTLGRRPRTIAAYSDRLIAFRIFARSQEVKHVREVTIGVVRSYHNHLSATCRASSVLAYMSTVAGFLRWCHERGKLLADIASRIELPKRRSELPPKPLSPDEVAALVDMSGGNTTARKRDRAMVELLYGCGLRAAEALALNIRDIDFEERTVFVRGKGDKDRLLPVNDAALDALKVYLASRKGRPRKNSPLFVLHNGARAGERFNHNSLGALFRRMNSAFPKHVYPHLLRHCFAIHLLQGGADIRHVQALLGHESPDTTSKYLRLVKADLKRAYDTAIEHILAPA